MAEYHASAPCDGFLPMIRTPEDPAELGPSAYKPTYVVAPVEVDFIRLLARLQGEDVGR